MYKYTVSLVLFSHFSEMKVRVGYVLLCDRKYILT
jgi:hypothetical protein